MFGVQFYPTPPALVERMLDKVDFSRVTFALEPSAGKGDIAAGIKQRMQKDRWQLDCVEIDSDLRAILKDRGYTVIGDDFLRWDGKTRYDLIAANPPFADGDKHLLHMLDLMRNGGQIVCLLNATTIADAESPRRRDLLQRLDKYGADIEIIPDAFSDAERKAKVDCALVYVDIPQTEERDILADLTEALDLPDSQETCTDIIGGDIFESLVRQYDFEARLGLKIIDDYKQYSKYVPAPQNEVGRADCIIGLNVISQESENEALTQQNKYIRELRYKYWATLFGRREMQRLMTREVRQQYSAKLHSLRSYDFTLSNIKQLQIDLSASLVDSVEEAIMKMFDDLTYEHSMGNNSNIHYYNGWKTNKACKVSGKVILPFYGLYDNRWGGSWSFWKAADYMMELEKILGYLDNGRTDGANYTDVVRAFERKSYAGERIQCKFFDVSFKKKGTVHIWFTDENLLKKLNIFGGRNKNWLPEDYGRKQHDAMDKDEQSTVDSFEGKTEYQKTCAASGFYIGKPGLVMIGV